MKYFILVMLCLSLAGCDQSTLLKKNIEEQIEALDVVLFPILLSSYQWEVFSNQKITQKEFSTDDLPHGSYQWARFRSAIGKNIGQSLDFCLGVRNTLQGMDLVLTSLLHGEVCEDANEILAKVEGLKRVLWIWPKGDYPYNLTLRFEWIVAGQWKSSHHFFPLVHWPEYHQKISWGSAWWNQPIPANYFANFPPMPKFLIFLPLEKLDLNPTFSTLLFHSDVSNWKEAVRCFSVADDCQATMPYQCHLCPQGHFTLYNKKCATAGTSYCGEINCGAKDQPACYLGKEHIKQEDFRGCHAYSEEWSCQKGLEIKCGEWGATCH